MDESHRDVYRHAICYDVAFGFRDVAGECDTLTTLLHRHTGRSAGKVLDLASGPAAHAREFARRGASATALDAVQPMLDYALYCAQRDGVRLTAVRADMQCFQIEESFDLAIMLMDSVTYLLDNAAVLEHLQCVARHLRSGGLYVLEMSHPRDAFDVGKSTSTRWTSELNGIRVDMEWGDQGDAFDPISQVDEVTVRMAWSGAEGSGQVVERARQRRFTANELDALVRANGEFEIVEWLGSLAPCVRFSNEPEAWRMIPVLRKRTITL